MHRKQESAKNPVTPAALEIFMTQYCVAKNVKDPFYDSSVLQAIHIPKTV
jgi:hypothetical protein